MRMMMRRESADLRNQAPQVIFIAFDTRELDADHARGLRNMVIMLCAAGVVMTATVLAQFWFRRYQRSRKQLQKKSCWRSVIWPRASPMKSATRYHP